ncbi:MAG: SRPBCC family protein [Bacteroidia bacterium]
MPNPLTITQNIAIQATPEAIFKILADVEHWHLWTASIKKIVLINNTVLGPGVSAKVFQPRLLPNVWKVIQYEENRSFTWVSKSPGLTMTAGHALSPGDNHTAVSLTMTYEGFLAKLLYKMTANLTSQYMTMEIEGLKKVCEQRPSGTN